MNVFMCIHSFVNTPTVTVHLLSAQLLQIIVWHLNALPISRTLLRHYRDSLLSNLTSLGKYRLIYFTTITIAHVRFTSRDWVRKQLLVVSSQLSPLHPPILPTSIPHSITIKLLDQYQPYSPSLHNSPFHHHKTTWPVPTTQPLTVQLSISSPQNHLTSTNHTAPHCTTLHSITT
jgi:hypothetical protein